MPDLTIVCWFWRRNGLSGKHKPEAVTILRNMVRRNLSIPHRFVCITNCPQLIDPSIETIALWNDLFDLGRCFVRLKAFAPEMAEIIGPRFAWIDLDVVVTGDLTPLFSGGEDFKISGVELREQPYNGSLVMMKAGARSQVWTTWDQALYLRVMKEKNYGGTDQGWMAVCLGEHEAVWGRQDGVYNYREQIDPPRIVGTGGALPRNARLVVMNGQFSPDCAVCRAKSPWIAEFYR